MVAFVCQALVSQALRHSPHLQEPWLVFVVQVLLGPIVLHQYLLVLRLPVVTVLLVQKILLEALATLVIALGLTTEADTVNWRLIFAPKMNQPAKMEALVCNNLREDTCANALLSMLE